MVMMVKKQEVDKELVIQLFEGIAAAEQWQPGDQLRAHVERSVYFGVWVRPDKSLG